MATINGTEGDDGLVGGDENDTINGLGGHDRLFGGLGDDLLDGGDGNDQLNFDDGNDTLLGEGGNDFFLLESRFGRVLGQDVLDGGSGIDTLSFLSAGTAGVTVDAASGTFAGPRPGDGGTLTSIENFHGTNFADSITGDASANVIDGHGGDDTLDGGGGDDTLWGSSVVAGNELLIGGDGNDSLRGGGGGSGTLQGGAGDDILHGGTGNDVVAGDAGNDLVRGNSGNDTLTGGAGADNFMFASNPHPLHADLITDFASGVDKLRLEALVMPALGRGGNFTAGDARFHAAAGASSGHDADDRIIYDTSSGDLWYDADGNGTGPAQLIATLQGAPMLTATDITVDHGDGPGQAVTGTPGNDSLVGTFGDDTIEGLAGNDTLEGSLGDDRLDGGTGNDSLIGNDGADLMIGGDGNDTLESGFVDSTNGEHDPASNTMNGGLGDDHYRMDDTNDVLIDDGGIDTIVAVDMDWTLGAGFENLILRNDVHEGPQIGIGNELDNHMSVTYAGSRLEGRGGNDTLIGAGAQSGNQLFGGDGNDSLRGGSGFGDSLDGGAGNDTLDGSGDDIYVFSVAPGPANADRVLGFDVNSAVIQLDGRVHANIGVSGRFAAGDARFHSAAGASAGHDADDRVVYNTTTGELLYDVDGNGAGAAQLIATLSGTPSLSAANIEVINGSSPNVFTGTEGDDSLVGTSTDDTILGLGGNDTLDGGPGGNDSLDGGPGNDIYYAREGDVLADTGGGIDLVIATAWTLGAGLENLTLINGGGFHVGVGNELANVIDGRDVDDVVNLTGGGGNDTLYGADGFQAHDALGGGDGDDEINGGSANDGIHGDAGNDLLFGDDGNDAIHGGAGNDTMFGGAGNEHFFFTGAGVSEIGQDSVDGGAGFDTLQYRSLDSSAVVVDFGTGTAVGGGPGGSGHVTFAGIERVSATRFADRLTGDASANSLAGNEGDDTLDGSAGIDLLEGGAGADSFLFTVAPSASNADTIVDFATGTDKIHLDRAMHANLGASGNFAAGDARFAANASGTAQDASDRVIYSTSTGQLWYDADGNGAGAAQLIAQAIATMTASDIVVVGSAGGSVINGTAGDDTLSGTAGDDTINGLGGNDLVRAGSSGGADAIDGGAGRDSIESASRATSAMVVDFVFGTITGGSPGTINFTGIERIVAGNFNDSLTGNAAAQNLTGQGGNDALWGAGGLDTLWGGAGVDSFIFRELGTANADRIADWTSGSDKLVVNGSVMSTLGEVGPFTAGDARFWSSSSGTAHDADDRVIFNTTTRQVFYDGDGSGSAAAQLIATLQTGATLVATDIMVEGAIGGVVINGTAGSDTLSGTAGDDTINGLGGNDVVRAGSTGGADVVDGGAGFDSIEFANRATSAVVVDFSAGTITGGISGTISFAGVERVVAGNFNDSLAGNAAGQNLAGQAGADTLWGSGGFDTLWGGGGADTFIFREMGVANADRIADWASASDQLQLDDSAFTAIGALGDFAADEARFEANGTGTATDTSDRVIYNTSTGSLYYDADGSGTGAAQLIATFTGNPAVAATDITVI